MKFPKVYIIAFKYNGWVVIKQIYWGILPEEARKELMNFYGFILRKQRD